MHDGWIWTKIRYGMRPTFFNLSCQKCNAYDALYCCLLRQFAITQECGDACSHHWYSWVNNSAGLQAHVQRDTPHPLPLQLSSLLFTPAWAHPSNIIILLQFLWVWICQTHSYFMYLHSISTNLLHQTSSQENVCLKERQTSDLSQAGFMAVFSFNWNTHMSRWASHWHTHHLSQTGMLLWDANDIQMYSVQCVCASCSQRMLCPYMD